MAKIGIKGLVYAPYSTGGSGSAVTYGTGAALDDYMVRADITENRNKTPFYADDHQIDQENELTGVDVSLELSNMTDTMEKAFLGYTAGTGDELNVAAGDAPFVGVGFHRKERFKGAVTYHGFWIYKVQFSKDSDSTQTKGENVDFQTETISGSAVSVVLTTAGDPIYYSHIRSTAEATVVSWVKGKAGIS